MPPDAPVQQDPTPPSAGAPAGGVALPKPGPVDLFIAEQPEPLRLLMEMSRIFLHGSAPGLREGIKWRVPTFMMEHNLFYLNPQPADRSGPAHVVLGFCNGAKMPEFHKVFDKVLAEVAHVAIRSLDDLRRPGLREAVRAAAGLPQDDAVRLRDHAPIGAAERDERVRAMQ